MSIPPLSPPLWGLVFVLGSCAALWLLSLRLRDVSIMDIFWGPGIAGVADIAAWLGRAGGERASVVLFLVNLWAIRLAAHIWVRRSSPDVGGEDHRYAALRRQSGPRWWWASLVQVFLLQAILIWFIAAPVVAALLSSRAPLGWLDWLGTGLATLGLLIETVADSQLSRFRLQLANRGKVMKGGLWGWSRHPNYFGEVLLWWGLFALGFAAAHRWWLVLSPLLVCFLLAHVGVSLIENGIEARRPGYADYRRRVSAFIPMPPWRRPR
jgi:steroid 5-alpha reductase family enzyme